MAVSVPVQLLVSAGVEAITIPLGNVSTSDGLNVTELVFGLDTVMVRVELPPAVMLAGLKAFPIVGGTGTGGGVPGMTAKVAIAAPSTLV